MDGEETKSIEMEYVEREIMGQYVDRKEEGDGPQIPVALASSRLSARSPFPSTRTTRLASFQM